MTDPIGAASPVPAPASPKDAALRKVARQLEGVFTEQLFKAMRETVPKDQGIFSGGSGEEMFTGLLDQHLAADTPTRWQHGIGEALYRQLRGKLNVTDAGAPTPDAAAAHPTATAASAAGRPGAHLTTTAGDAGR